MLGQSAEMIRCEHLLIHMLSTSPPKKMLNLFNLLTNSYFLRWKMNMPSIFAKDFAAAATISLRNVLNYFSIIILIVMNYTASTKT